MSDIKTYFKSHSDDKFRDIFVGVDFVGRSSNCFFEQNLHPGDLVKWRFNDDFTKLGLGYNELGMIISNTQEYCTVLWSV